MRTRYYIDHQRGFANEFQILAADDEATAHEIETTEQTQSCKIGRITAKEARRLLALADYYRRTNGQGYAGAAQSSDYDPHERHEVRSEAALMPYLPQMTREYLAERRENR